MDESQNTDEFEDALAQAVGAFDRTGPFICECELKRSQSELTELVRANGADAIPAGFYIRKTIDESAGIGAAYERLFFAQKSGRVFPHLPKIVSASRANGKLTVVMNRVAGETLDELALCMGASPVLAALVFPDLCTAVDELHAGFNGSDTAAGTPVIHRDLKPSNVMVAFSAGGGGTVPYGAFDDIISDADGPCGGRKQAHACCSSGMSPAPPARVTLIDLGIARTWRRGADADTVRFGTRSYAPPEQFGFGQTTVLSDIYALGGLLYFCLVGKDPAPGRSAVELADEATIPEPFVQVIARAMAFDPSQRFVSAKAMLRAVDTAYRRSFGTGIEAYAKAAYSKLSPAKVKVSRRTNAAIDNPAPVPSPASVSTFKPPLVERAPKAVGVAWNIVLLAVCALVLAGCWFAVFEPTGANVRLSTSYLLFEYTLSIALPYLGLTYILLDKRRLFRRLKPKRRLNRLMLWLVLVGATAFCWAIVLAMGVTVGQP